MRTQRQPQLRRGFSRLCRYMPPIFFLAIPVVMFAAMPATGQSNQGAPKSDAQPVAQDDEPEANPARPTVSNPATLTPVGYLQFETGTLGATNSPEFSTRYEFNEVVKLTVSRRLEFMESSEPAVHYTVNGLPANGMAEVFLGAQIVLFPGEGAKPTLSASYSRRVYDGGAPELDIGRGPGAQAAIRPDAFDFPSARERVRLLWGNLALLAAFPA
jgi:hypothetical protein